MQDAKEEVRSRLNIEDVIAEYVQLKRAGRNFKGLSPFTAEKTPSFFVSPDKHIWHDFSSNKGGDIFAFIMEVEGMEFRDSLEHLARKAGVDLSVYETAGNKDLARRKKQALLAHQKAAKYYQHSLLKNQHAVDYVFKKRGLSKKVVIDFQIGYAPDNGTALVDYLQKNGFSKKDLADAGLTNRFGGDMFRGRMAVPLMDASGQVIGFTARTIGEAPPNSPKYLNTPQTVLYDKSRHIFGFSQAKEAIRRKNHVVIVEGNLDVISSHKAGVEQVVATAGTAMTEHHLRALKRLTDDVRLAYDGDKAGIAATERAIGIASRVGVRLTIITLPDNAKDPDELIQADVTKWIAAIEDAQPAVDWVLAQYAEREDVTSAAGKRAFTTAGLSVINELGDPVEREHYEAKIAKMIGSSLESIRAKAQQTEQQSSQKLKTVKAAPSKNSDEHLQQDLVLAVGLIDVPSRELLRHTNSELFIGEDRQAVLKYLADNQTITDSVVPSELREIETYVKILLLKAEARYGAWSEQDRYFEAARLLRLIEQENKKQNQQELTNQLRNAEMTGDEATSERLRGELNELIKEIARGKR